MPEVLRHRVQGHQHDGWNRDDHPRSRRYRQTLSERDANGRGDYGREDGGQRCDNAHSPEGESAVESHRAEAVPQAAQRTPSESAGGWPRWPIHGPHDDGRKEGEGLLDEDHRADGRPPSADPAHEVRGAVAESRREAEEDPNLVHRPNHWADSTDRRNGFC